MLVENQKVLFVNLPHKTRVQRRYMCSYNTPSMLFPPIELLYLAAIAREWHQCKVELIDCIANAVSLQSLLSTIDQIQPFMIVTITGFEIFEDDVQAISKIKESFPNIPLIVFGHYPTHFPKETLIHSNADFILEGEPDINFSSLLDFFNGDIAKSEIDGIFYFDGFKNLISQKGEGRIKKPNELPLPAHDLLDIDYYNEPFLAKPFALIQSARGCPYACNFCVRSYGERLALRSPQNIINEIIWLKQLYNIKSIRFIDDTFTATSKRVIKLCQLIIENDIDIEWTCLSRTDTLNEEMIMWMHKAGCKRVYLGVESGSPKILKTIDKQINIEESLENIRLLQKYKIEISAFFMVGYPNENEDDFLQSVNLAKRAKFDYIIVSRFLPYPGTRFFDQNLDLISFSLFPYNINFNDEKMIAVGKKREKLFYKEYYLSVAYFSRFCNHLLKYPKETLKLTLKSLKYIFINNKNTIRDDYI